MTMSAPQLFRAHTSTLLSIPVQVEVLEMNPGERSCNPGERSCNGEVRNLSLNSAELFSSFHKLISFSLNENLVIVLCKVFPLQHQLPFWLDINSSLSPSWTQCREDQLLYCHQTGLCGQLGKNAKKFQHLWEVWPWASQAHTVFLLSLSSLVKGSIIPPNSALGWGQSRKSPNAISFLKIQLLFKNREYLGKKNVSCTECWIPWSHGKEPGNIPPKLMVPRAMAAVPGRPKEDQDKNPSRESGNESFPAFLLALIKLIVILVNSHTPSLPLSVFLPCKSVQQGGCTQLSKLKF